jgi:hypothetical protein
MQKGEVISEKGINRNILFMVLGYRYIAAGSVFRGANSSLFHKDSDSQTLVPSIMNKNLSIVFLIGPHIIPGTGAMS